MRGIHARVLAVIVAMTFAVLGVVTMNVQAQAESLGTGSVQSVQGQTSVENDVTICHRSDSDTNPYGPKAITVDPASIITSGHGDHTGPVWRPGLKDAHIIWGDIIPPFDGFAGLNWTADGQAILANDCQIPAAATLAAPAVSESECVGTPPVPSAPTLTVPTNTTSVSYTVSKPGPYAAGDSVSVTATAAAGYWFAEQNASPPPSWVPITAPGWTVGADLTTATYAVTFAVPVCETVLIDATATAPSFADAVCGTDGNPTTATYTVPEVTGVQYRIGEDVATAGVHEATDGASVTITAHAAKGYRLTNEVAEWNHRFAETPDCSGIGGLHAVSVPNPSFRNSVCGSDGLPTQATYTLVARDHVYYRVGGQLVQAGTYPAADASTLSVVASSDPDWKISGPSTFTHTFAATPVCSGVLPEVITPGTPPLANTGAGAIRQEIAWALGLVLGGSALLITALLTTGRRLRRGES